MPIQEKTIHSLGELIDSVTPATPDPASGHRRDPSVYHGASAADQPLLTSLDRLGGTDPPHTKADLEEHILRNFVRYSRAYLPTTPSSDWELLVIAQHHGVPTRLLDWSYSPLVAAHFAISSVHPGDACAIWRLDWQKVHRAFDLPELVFLIDDLRALHLVDSEEAFTPWDLFTGTASNFACLIEPPSLDTRIVAQAAAFTLCSENTIPFETFLARHELSDALTKFIVPADAVHHLRDQLDLVGIEERHLFPNLDGVAASIRRYYG